MTLRRLLLVVLGGTIGTAVRLGMALSIPDAGGLPVATLAVNLIGALLIGILAVRLPGDSDMRTFLGAGILGGFTTYSAFAVGTVQLWAQSPLLAGLYAILTLTLGVAVAVLGMRIAKSRDAR
ncbi:MULTISPECIES: CrcB family protein [Microbacterium]|uniref:fluoride efflux transporter FluC n=1 Tax=Microbacterium TaxID=33882 RepID=UPI00051A456C|nr:CrcB family protein [Microbacterium profundi]MCE7481103.1 CrcB family protein [Microbacterium profundi]